jgi:hypothetical protein
VEIVKMRQIVLNPTLHREASCHTSMIEPVSSQHIV